MERIPIYLPEIFQDTKFPVYLPRTFVMDILRKNVVDELKIIFEYNRMAKYLNKPTLKTCPTQEQFKEIWRLWTEFHIFTISYGYNIDW